MLRRLAPLKRILTTIRHLAKKMADGYLVLWFYASKKRHTINIQNCTKRWKLTFSHISSRSKVKIAEVRTKFVLIRQSSLDQPLAVYCTVPLVLRNTEYHVWQLWLVSINDVRAKSLMNGDTPNLNWYSIIYQSVPLKYFRSHDQRVAGWSRTVTTMPIEDVEKIIRKEPLEDYYEVGSELGRWVPE